MNLKLEYKRTPLFATQNFTLVLFVWKVIDSFKSLPSFLSRHLWQCLWITSSKYRIETSDAISKLIIIMKHYLSFQDDKPIGSKGIQPRRLDIMSRTEPIFNAKTGLPISSSPVCVTYFKLHFVKMQYWSWLHFDVIPWKRQLNCSTYDISHVIIS